MKRDIEMERERGRKVERQNEMVMEMKGEGGGELARKR